MRHHLISLLFFCLMALPAFDTLADDLPPAQVGVSPNLFQGIRLDGSTLNRSLRFYNYKNTPVKVAVEVKNWTLDAAGDIKLLPPDPQSLDQWIVINPLTFTVPPKQSQVIRFAIRPRMKPAPGEHRAIIYLSEVPIESEMKASLQTLFRIGIGVYGNADPVRKQAVLHRLSLNNKRLDADIENTGNVHARLTGEYAIWKQTALPGTVTPETAFPAISTATKPEGLMQKGQLNGAPVLPGSRRIVTTGLPENPSGTYIIAVKDTLAGTPRFHTYTLNK